MALRDAWMAAVASRDVSALGDLLTEDYEVWAHGAPAVCGPTSAAAAMAAALAQFAVERPSNPSRQLSAATGHSSAGSTRCRPAP